MTADEVNNLPEMKAFNVAQAAYEKASSGHYGYHRVVSYEEYDAAMKARDAAMTAAVAAAAAAGAIPRYAHRGGVNITRAFDGTSVVLIDAAGHVYAEVGSYKLDMVLRTDKVLEDLITVPAGVHRLLEIRGDDPWSGIYPLLAPRAAVVAVLKAALAEVDR